MVRSSTAALARSSTCQLDISPITGLTTMLKLFLTRMRAPSRGRPLNGGGRGSASVLTEVLRHVVQRALELLLVLLLVLHPKPLHEFGRLSLDQVCLISESRNDER
eukprot:CAMPEP_0181394460 /NCGR_PEP_ID=MMETSP1106-20121128/27794_1 /TAXON_ID=81844 /ORGANISM="Mantoniella antarctica, Strain SL-175" /LENGTH=105 /DNA_ID=CAMNT_0023515967 /DNA_START=275 /DNA_END=593 /DNA_ORIENTATION=-